MQTRRLLPMSVIISIWVISGKTSITSAWSATITIRINVTIERSGDIVVEVEDEERKDSGSGRSGVQA